MVSLINERVANKPVYEKFQNPDQGQTEKASDDRGNGSDNRIVLRDLALSYGDRAIFENLNLCFEKGKSYLITGTSGCGKSSLLKMVAGEMAPSAGEISVFGSRPESYPLVSYMSQDTYIFEDTVRDNITLGKEKSKAEIDALIDFLQLNLDCDEKIDSSREISGGEKKRIGLARAFVTTNEVMLLDEITNGLNHALAMEITKKILGIFEDHLAVMVDRLIQQFNIQKNLFVVGFIIRQGCNVFDPGTEIDVGQPLQLFHQCFTLAIWDMAGKKQAVD